MLRSASVFAADNRQSGCAENADLVVGVAHIEKDKGSMKKKTR